MESSSWNHQQEPGVTDCVSAEHHLPMPQNVPWAQASAAADPSCGRLSRMEDCRSARRIVRSRASSVPFEIV